MPTTLTADQAEQLADGLVDCANSIDRRIISDWKTLDANSRQKLMDLAQQMRAKSALLVNIAVGMILDDANDAFGQIASATKAGQAAIENIQTVNKVMNIAAAVVAVGGAVASKDLMASIKAFSNVFDQIA